MRTITQPQGASALKRTFEDDYEEDFEETGEKGYKGSYEEDDEEEPVTFVKMKPGKRERARIRAIAHARPTRKTSYDASRAMKMRSSLPVRAARITNLPSTPPCWHPGAIPPGFSPR